MTRPELTTPAVTILFTFHYNGVQCVGQVTVPAPDIRAAISDTLDTLEETLGQSVIFSAAIATTLPTQ